MKKSDFSYTTSSQGYKLFYKHRFIGAYSTGEPLEGQPGYAARDKHIDMAQSEIAAILVGRGLPLFQNNCAKIDESWERLKREYEKEVVCNLQEEKEE